MARIEDIKWADWKVGLTAYGSVVNHQLGEMMTAAETSTVPLYVAVMGSMREAAYEPAVYTLLLVSRQKTADGIDEQR